MGSPRRLNKGEGRGVEKMEKRKRNGKRVKEVKCRG